jgi:hypothetical protein
MEPKKPAGNIGIYKIGANRSAISILHSQAASGGDRLNWCIE